MAQYLTPEGLEKLKKELENLTTVKRKEIAARLKHAISFGDLKENAAYSDAKEEQGFLEGRISELKGIISSAKLIEKKNTKDIQIGSTVLVCCGGKKEKFHIVGPEEADIFCGKISHQSPLGKALLGKTKGSKVDIKTLDGKIEYEIIEIIY
jgi:transcription elongation factor GreA